MRKFVAVLGLSILPMMAMAAESAPVSNNHYFQEFDNQFSIGFGGTYGNLSNAYGQNSNYGTTFIGLSVERLFDIGLWGRVDASLMTGYSNYNSTNQNAVTGPLGQDPSVAGINFKLGYAFLPIQEHLLVTPYILLGRNTNLTSNSLNNNTSPSGGGTSQLNSNVTQDYFWTMGFGGRVEYRINKVFELYADQGFLYNSDQSQPSSTYTPANNYQLVSTVGAKFNVWENLQLGLQGFYSYNQLSGAVTSAQQYQLYQQSQIGGLASIGLNY
ncbi:MAG: hypothetical protein E6Q33_05320 [Neisseriales bacterium]|jgi:hypothetical protein|nr:MAG: hypothetical protein E6Q33_05320 [Neisseriales bacterium]